MKSSTNPVYFSFLLLLLVSLGSMTTTLAQTNNPFDLSPRLNNTADTTVREKTLSSGNPFDIQVISVPKSAQPAMPEIKIDSTSKDTKSQTINPRRPKSKGSFLFGIIVGLLILSAVVITLFREVIEKSFKAFLNDNLLNQLHRDQGAVIQIPYQILYVLFFLNAGMFLYLLLGYLGHLPFNSNWYNLLASIGLVIAGYSLKHLVLAFLGWLFPISKEINIYSFTIVIFNIILGLIFIPFNVAIAYASPEIVTGAVWGCLGLLGLIYLFRQLRGLFVAGRFLALHKLHFLLYICAIEIAPALVVIRFILESSGN